MNNENLQNQHSSFPFPEGISTKSSLSSESRHIGKDLSSELKIMRIQEDKNTSSSINPEDEDYDNIVFEDDHLDEDSDDSNTLNLIKGKESVLKESKEEKNDEISKEKNKKSRRSDRIRTSRTSPSPSSPTLTSTSPTTVQSPMESPNTTPKNSKKNPSLKSKNIGLVLPSKKKKKTSIDGETTKNKQNESSESILQKNKQKINKILARQGIQHSPCFISLKKETKHI